MKIDIRYKLMESATWIHYPIFPEQYFEPLDENRAYEWDDVPRHLHAAEFLPVSKAEVSETELRIWDPDEHLRLTIGEVFWNAGWNTIIQRIEDNSTLLIAQLRLAGPPVIYHTIRLNREGDGRLFLEHVQLVVTNKGDVPGPSHVLSLPPLIGITPQKRPVALRYRLVGSTEWRTHPLTPMEYYELREHGASLNWEDALKHKHAAEYLPFPPEQIVETEVRLEFDGERWRREVLEVLWNHGQNRIVKCVDERYTLLNIQVCIQEELLGHHTIRLLRNIDESGVLEHEIDIEGMGNEGRVLIVRRRL